VKGIAVSGFLDKLIDSADHVVDSGGSDSESSSVATDDTFERMMVSQRAYKEDRGKEKAAQEEQSRAAASGGGGSRSDHLVAPHSPSPSHSRGQEETEAPRHGTLKGTRSTPLPAAAGSDKPFVRKRKARGTQTDLTGSVRGVEEHEEDASVAVVRGMNKRSKSVAARPGGDHSIYVHIW